MSVIVAIKHNNRIYIGCDSQATSGGTRTTLKNYNNYKIWKVNSVDNCLMGSVGAMRDACIIRTMDNLVSDYVVYRNGVNYDFIVNSVLPDIIDRLRSARYIPDGHFDSMDSSYLFAYNDQLYLIGSDGSVLEIEDFVAIGSGKSEAIGSLLTSQGDKPKERIVKAIKASATSDIYVDYPIIISDTKNTEFEVITEQNEQKYL